jgi:hypothetical protein
MVETPFALTVAGRRSRFLGMPDVFSCPDRRWLPGRGLVPMYRKESPCPTGMAWRAPSSREAVRVGEPRYEAAGCDRFSLAGTRRAFFELAACAALDAKRFGVGLF